MSETHLNNNIKRGLHGISIPCQKHPNKNIEYICVDKTCDEKLFCTTCVFRGDYCRHQDYTRDLGEFLDEQKKQFEMRGLISHPNIYNFIGDINKSEADYKNLIKKQINSVDDHFDKLVHDILKTIEEIKTNIISQLKEYEANFMKYLKILDARVTLNFKNVFAISEYRTFEDMITKFAPYSQSSLLDMLRPILSNYFEQFNAPDDVNNCFQTLLSLQQELPGFDVKRFESIKGYFNVFADKIKQASTTLVNLGTDNIQQNMTFIDPDTPELVKRTNPLILDTGLNLSKLSSKSTNNLGAMHTHSSEFLGNISNVNIFDKMPSKGQKLDPQATPQKVDYKWGKNIRNVNVKRIEFSTSFDTQHTRTVFCLKYLGNRLVATCSDDGLIKIWDIITFNCVKTYRGHASGVRSLALLADGNMVSGSWDHTLKIWNTSSLNTLQTVNKNNNSLLTSSITKQKYTGDLIKTLPGHGNSILFVNVLPDGVTIASGSTDFTMKLWDSEQGTCLKTYNGHQGEVLSIAVRKTREVLITGSGDRTIKFWNYGKKYNTSCVKTLDGHTGLVWSVIILNDDVTLLSASGDKSIKVWNSETGQCLTTLIGHSNQILSIKEFKDQTFISCDSDGFIKVWSIEDWKCVKTVKSSRGGIYCLETTEDYMIMSSGIDKQISIWNQN